jgi:predicted nuclease with TOPRIM domain
MDSNEAADRMHALYKEIDELKAENKKLKAKKQKLTKIIWRLAHRHKLLEAENAKLEEEISQRPTNDCVGYRYDPSQILP